MITSFEKSIISLGTYWNRILYLHASYLVYFYISNRPKCQFFHFYDRCIFFILLYFTYTL